MTKKKFKIENLSNLDSTSYVTVLSQTFCPVYGCFLDNTVLLINTTVPK